MSECLGLKPEVSKFDSRRLPAFSLSPHSISTPILFSVSQPFYCALSVYIPAVPTPDLKDLMTALYRNVADKWKTIGVYLKISDLASIETRHHSDPHLCLLEMLDAWLKRVDPLPTWSAIIEAVEFLGEEQLGRRLREKYCP